MLYFKKKKGAGGTRREELIRETTASVNKTGRAFNTTTSSAILNTRLLNQRVNGVSIRKYPIGSIMAGSYSSEAEE